MREMNIAGAYFISRLKTFNKKQLSLISLIVTYYNVIFYLLLYNIYTNFGYIVFIEFQGLPQSIKHAPH
jgi:hypothetical protein